MVVPYGIAGLPSDHLRTGISRSRTGESGFPAVVVPSMIAPFPSFKPHAASGSTAR
jgi:hypothetical protein